MLKRIATVAACLLVGLPCVRTDAGGLGPDIGRDIERGLGRMVADELEAAYGVVDDPLLTGWVNRVGQRLASVSGRTDVKYQFKVLDSDDVNAVAAPGGYIYVNRGTVRFVQSEDELAAVVGHEVGHVAGKHAMKQLGAQVLGTLAMIGFQAVHANTLKTVGGIAGGLAMLKFSRDEENDADRRGLRNSVNSGYDGRAMLGFFRRLQATEKEHPSKLEVYFLTHPPTDERLKRIEKEPGTAQTASNATSLARGLADRFLYREAAEAYRRALAQDPSDPAARLGLQQVQSRLPRVKEPAILAAAERAQVLVKLGALETAVEAVRSRARQDDTEVARGQHSAEDELESTARSLASVGQMLRRNDTDQIHEYGRMVRTFDKATRVGANLRATGDLAGTTLDDITRLAADLRASIAAGDADAAKQVGPLAAALPGMLADLADGLKRARARAGDAREGARLLRLAADSLATSYRVPFGYTEGQFSLLDLQVTSAQDTLGDSVSATRMALAQIGHAHTLQLVARISYLTRLAAPDDAATAAIIAHYLGVEPAAVTEMRGRMAFGDAALALADEELAKARAKKKSTKPDRGARESAADRSVHEGLRWENAAVLFNLMANDLQKEIG